MSDEFIPEEIKLFRAARAFIITTSTESGEHITPLHRWLSIRLVLEGGFLPEELSPTPPLRSEYRDGGWRLSFNPSAENKKEQIVLGALKSKRIDIVVGKKGIGPVLAISVKGTSKAFRNLVNRTEEAIGDCANIHIMYPRTCLWVRALSSCYRHHRQDAQTQRHSSKRRQGCSFFGQGLRTNP